MADWVTRIREGNLSIQFFEWLEWLEWLECISDLLHLLDQVRQEVRPLSWRKPIMGSRTQNDGCAAAGPEGLAFGNYSLYAIGQIDRGLLLRPGGLAAGIPEGVTAEGSTGEYGTLLLC